jgi:hypothetical protein
MRVNRRWDKPRRGRRRRSAQGPGHGARLDDPLQAGPKPKQRKGAVAETRCKTPRLRPSAVRKRGGEVGEAKQVDAVIDVGL